MALDRDNRIVFRTGTRAPVCTHSLTKVLKEELRRRVAARDPISLQWFKCVDQLRGYGEQGSPYKDVIEIDRKVRTRWGAQGAALYTEEMVDSVCTLHTLLNLCSDRNPHQGNNTGGGGGDGGGGGSGSEGRNGGKDGKGRDFEGGRGNGKPGP